MFCLHGTVMEQVAFKGLELSYGYEKTLLCSVYVYHDKFIHVRFLAATPIRGKRGRGRIQVTREADPETVACFGN